MSVPATMPQAELATTDHQTPNNSQNAPKKQEVTLELHKYILLLASLVATVTYSAGFSPPGDVWQDTAAGHIAGDPIIRDTHHKRYVAFFYCNATAFAASLVVIVITLILAYLDDNKDKDQYSDSFIVGQYRDRPWIAVRPLQLVMVVDLLSLMGAYAAGTCWDTFTTVYSSVLVAFVFFYVVGQVIVASCSCSCFTDTSSSGVPNKVEQLNVDDRCSCSCFTTNTGSGGVPNKVPTDADDSGSGGMMTEVEEEERRKVEERFRKVLMLLATFAVSITYLAGLSTPGGFWDSTGAGHRPGDAILKDRHNRRLAVFFAFNTMAFGASLLIIVVLLDRLLRKKNAYVFIVVALLSLIGAYDTGSCRHTDTTGYVFSLIPAVLVYILFLLMVASAIDAIRKWNQEPVQEQQEMAKNAGDSPTNGREDQPNPVQAAAEQPQEEPPLTEKEKAAKKARSLVLLLATLAATITYQAGLDPPGGVWQDNSGGHTAGDPILLTTNRRRYKAFFYCNSVSLVASLVAVAMVPAQNKLLLKHHVLEAVMILDLFGLIGAYAAGSCRDVNTSIHAMALAGAVLVYVVIHVVFITLDDDMHTRSDSDKEEDNKLVEKMRKRMLLFAILAATITYQAGLTPPGGFLLQDDQSGAGHGHHAGDPVLLYNFPRRYKAFFYCNSVSFMLSIALIILLVNPNLYRPAIRTHALSVCTAAGLFGLMGAYAAGSTQHLKTSVYVFVLIAVVLVCIALLFLVFLLTDGGGGTKAPATVRGTSDTAATQEAEMEAGPQVAAPTVSNGSTSTTTTNTQGAAMETNTQLAVTTSSTSSTRAVTTTTSTSTSSSTTKDNKEATKEDKREHANRKYLMVLGILVASVTYQAGLEPPGGAWQSSSGWYEAGNPVMHDNRRHRYLAFFYSNSTSFMASIVVILLLLVPEPEKLIGIRNVDWSRKWLLVMNTTIVLDLLGLLGAYAAGSSRRWKTSVYVLLLVIAVLVYMAFHLGLSRIIRKRSGQSAQRHDDTPAKPEAIATSPV